MKQRGEGRRPRQNGSWWRYQRTAKCDLWDLCHELLEERGLGGAELRRELARRLDRLGDAPGNDARQLDLPGEP